MKKLCLAFLIVFSTPVSAVFFSSTDLYQWLDNDLRGVETYQGGMAKGYLMGILDMLSSINPPLVCYPEGISALKLKMVVYDYLHSNPDLKHLSVDKLVYKALLKEWPCQ
ncbi:Rap1a/Tai family immunity protein [Methylomonas sp. AM2-LC]|uniref:Rap1a/Tai family immunity protein n=1 Tax=Methylomonas sp. AM2-LC TaxID=3153301 RepID=UPI003263FE6B